MDFNFNEELTKEPTQLQNLNDSHQNEDTYSVDPVLSELYKKYGKKYIRNILYTYFFVEGFGLRKFDKREVKIVEKIKNGVKDFSEFGTDLFPKKPKKDIYADFFESFSNWVALEHVTIPSYFNEIPHFDGCKNLKEIVIPSNIRDSWYPDFAGCTSLKEVTFEPNQNISLLSESMFRFDRSLEHIDLSPCEHLMFIGIRCFQGCHKLDENGIVFPSKLSVIGDEAFRENNFKTLDLSSYKDLVLIKKTAFKGNENLKTVVFPNNPKLWIGSEAFADTALEEVHLPKTAKCFKSSFPKDCKIFFDL